MEHLQNIDEKWVEIIGFPDYIISNYGQIVKVPSGKSISVNQTASGVWAASLARDGIQYCRSIAFLVAKHFLQQPIREDFISPIHLDGVRSNYVASNLMWRPRWFAIEFHKEKLSKPFTTWNLNYELVETEEIFNTPYECSRRYGYMEKDIVLALSNGTVVFPDNVHFRFL